MVNLMAFCKSLEPVVGEEKGVGFNELNTAGSVLGTYVEGIPIPRADIQEPHAFEVQSEFLDN